MQNHGPFLTNWLRQNAAVHARLLQDGTLSDAAVDPVGAAPAAGSADFDVVLRRYRTNTLAAIAWRDLAGVDDVAATLAALTRLAERCIEAGLGEAERLVGARHGVPYAANGKPARLIVIGMGKLGGEELNFSSDVDLVFCHAAGGMSDGARPLEADAYFRRIAQRLIRILNATTAQGLVYRVDTRLRPFGETGALVVSTTAMEKYYRTHGREWERYAWIKARPIAGDLVGGRLLLEKLRSFVYRHYLDYGTLESIRDMKTLIDREVARAQLQDNIKLGAGGIREIEFVAQGLQLIRGGQEPALQDHRLLPVLARLARHGHLRAETAQELDRMYRFLRRIENRLQMWADRQTHELPADPIQRAALAAAMGYADWPAFAAALAAVRESVHAIYQRVFSKQRAEEPPRIARKERLQSLWDGELSQEESAQLLAAYGFTDSAAICSALVGLRAHSRQHEPHDRGRRWMKRLIPLLFATAVTLDDPDRALLRTLSVITAVSGRSTYVALLLEYPGGLATLMRLCAASPWITQHIGQQPVLLDTLLESDLYRPTERRTLAELLDDELAALPQHDLERRMDVLRRFTQRETLRIAAADVSDAMPLMIVSDHLTDLAEVVLNAALATAWTQMRVRYGLPRKDNGTCEDFCIIGYGKLGGFEMGYGSDLDLMFLYDGAHEKMTDGARQLSHHAYFTQLAQRLVHILSIRTPAGRAYEVDLRLRPGGDSGLLATHIEAFEPYQQARAWTWEHQALVRARVVAGSQALEQRFSAIRATALTRPRDVQTLAREVCSMRTRMRRNLDRSRADMLDVRHMAGGLIDIEFMAQFAVLRYGRECEELLLFPDTIRILETLESAGIADYTSTRTLVSAYRAYRRRIHKLALQEQEALIAADELAQRRSAVQALWQQWLEAAAG